MSQSPMENLAQAMRQHGLVRFFEQWGGGFVVAVSGQQATKGAGDGWALRCGRSVKGLLEQLLGVSRSLLGDEKGHQPCERVCLVVSIC